MKYTIFFDFDNTITASDVLDDIIINFSKDNRWEGLERKWRAGEIGSQEALSGQIRGLSITKQTLDKYLSRVKLDPHFKKLMRLFDTKRIQVFILSDNFDYMLKRILENNGMRKLKIYSNRLKLVKGRISLEFNFTNATCHICAHCKKDNLLANIETGSTAVYIGDGLSDTCVARYANIVFAKRDLLRYFKKNKLAHIPYRDLGDVYRYFKRSL